MTDIVEALVPGTDEDRAANARGVLSPSQEIAVGRLLRVPRRQTGTGVEVAVARRFAEALAVDLSGSSVETHTGRIDWAVGGSPGWLRRAGCVAFIDGRDEPAPVLGAAMPGRYVLYTLSECGAVVGIDAPGGDPLSPTAAHRARYAELLARLAPRRGPSLGWPLFLLVLGALAGAAALVGSLWPESTAGAVIAGAIPSDVFPVVRFAVPGLLLTVGLGILVARLRFRPRVVTGPCLLLATPSPGGAEDGLFDHPLTLLWDAPPRFDLAFQLGSHRIPLGPYAGTGLARAFVGGAKHSLSLHPDTGELIAVALPDDR